MYKNYIKRFIDLIAALIAFPIFVFVFITVGLLIFIEDKGPIFYNADRLGKNGKVFKMYKFRTMKVNAEDLRNEDGSTFNSKDDLRLTKIGKFVRKTSIDEIPQILNVLKNEMSIIGPRPDLPEHINYYKDQEAKKLNALPGITGYNQAYYRNSAEWKERLKNDVYYVDNISFWLDIRIFFKTINSIIMKKGVYVDTQVVYSKGDHFDAK